MQRFLPWKIIEYQLYLFQLEEYEIKRFLRSLFTKGFFPSKTLRRTLVLTNKVKLNLVLTNLIILFFAFALTYLLEASLRPINLLILFVIFSLLIYLGCVLYFVFSIQSATLTKPIEDYFKRQLIAKATQKIAKLPKLIIIGVTGSYGKTTMKEVLNNVLNERFQVVSTIGNFNTPIGISRIIISAVTDQTEVLIVEMGEYKKGDVAEICKIASPNIAIITGINEAHLERYGSMENAISTKFEIVEFAKKGVSVFLNADDKLIMGNYNRFLDLDSKVKFFSSLNDENSELKTTNINFDLKRPGIDFDLISTDYSITGIQTNFISEYIIGYASAAVQIGIQLGMALPEVKLGLNKVKPFEHRLQPKWNGDILIIDDTYNGNSNGAKEGIAILNKFKKNRKIYVTPGLVETGEFAKEVHFQIGSWLSKVADVVILTRNSVTPFIEEGLIANKFPSENIIWFDNSKETYAELYRHIKRGDVVLMQNDWTDNYF